MLLRTHRRLERKERFCFPGPPDVSSPTLAGGGHRGSRGTLPWSSVDGRPAPGAGSHRRIVHQSGFAGSLAKVAPMVNVSVSPFTSPSAQMWPLPKRPTAALVSGGSAPSRTSTGTANSISSRGTRANRLALTLLCARKPCSGACAFTIAEPRRRSAATSDGNRSRRVLHTFDDIGGGA